MCAHTLGQICFFVDAEGMRQYKESVRQRWAITLIAIQVIVARYGSACSFARVVASSFVIVRAFDGLFLR